MRFTITITAVAVGLTLTGIATAQASVEDFETGNPDGWEAWFSAYNAIEPAGGNPGAYLELDDFTQGPATCHFVEIFPDRAGAAPAHAGNWRAVGIAEVSIDLNIEQGLYDGNVVLTVFNDAGTPGSTADDCSVSLNLVAAGASAPGWATYTFDVPTAQTTLPAGWDFGSTTGCGATPDAVWNAVVQDVDRIEFLYDGDLPTFCQFTNWVLGVDNITVSTGGSISFGTNYCTAVPNSSGFAAAMEGVGSPVVANNDVTLRCIQMPTNAFGFFLTSQLQGFVSNPGGSAGNLCLGGAIGRYVGPNQIQFSGAVGEIELALDLTQHPTPTGLVSVQPGETWNFTAWFRDGGPQGATSNFGDGLAVVFL